MLYLHLNNQTLFKMEETKSHGGKRIGAGRKPKADEEKAKKLVLKAIKGIYNCDEDEEATVLFLQEFIPTARGQLFAAEHLIGKPKEQTENTFNFEGIKPVEWVD